MRSRVGKFSWNRTKIELFPYSQSDSNSNRIFFHSFWVGVCLWLSASHHCTRSLARFRGGASKRISREISGFLFRMFVELTYKKAFLNLNKNKYENSSSSSFSLGKSFFRYNNLMQLMAQEEHDKTYNLSIIIYARSNFNKILFYHCCAIFSLPVILWSLIFVISCSDVQRGVRTRK